MNGLVAHQSLTRYQTKVLLSGRPGPFIFGGYCVQEQVVHGDLQGLFGARHLLTEHPVILQFRGNDSNSEVLEWSQVVQRVVDWPAENDGVVRCFEASGVNHFRFVVYEQPGADSLDRYLSKDRALQPAMASYLIRQLALGLAELHRSGRTGVDIRPTRVWLESGELPRAKIFLDVFRAATTVDWSP